MTTRADDPYIINTIFKGRCPKCRRLASTVHELEPRSRGFDSMCMTNRVAIDFECHEEYHRLGASPEQVAEWQALTEKYLKTIGTWELYVTHDSRQQSSGVRSLL